MLKKIASLLVITILSLLLFTACGQVRFAIVEDSDESVSENKPVGTVLTVTEEGVSFAPEVSNASMIPDLQDSFFVSMPKYYVEFGMYPQTVAERKAVKAMSATTDSTGYYYSTYDNEHYAKITIANVYGNKYTFVNEKDITNRNTYYFKVEPIKWRIFGKLTDTGDIERLYLVSDLILDSSSYLAESSYFENPSDMIYYNRNVNARATDWVYSSLRKWLNGDFYRSAFSKQEKEKINMRVAGTSIGDDGEQVQETDNVFVMTYEQATAMEQSQVFSVVSDFARSKGTWMSIYPDFYGYGRWWTMTEGDTSYRICYGGTDNLVKVSSAGESIGATYMGVRPVICIDANDVIINIEKEEE